jgi:hypothetical protein
MPQETRDQSTQAPEDTPTRLRQKAQQMRAKARLRWLVSRAARFLFDDRLNEQLDRILYPV